MSKLTGGERMYNLNTLAKKINQTAHEKGFYDEKETTAAYMNRACANLHDEVSELHEAFRNGNLFKMTDKSIDMTFGEEELADIIIRALDTSQELNIDINAAVSKKMEYNLSRPYRHGNKKA